MHLVSTADQKHFVAVGPVPQGGAYMQVKTLDLIKPVEPATFNVIYQKKAVPSYNTLNSMRRVLNQLSSQPHPTQNHHQIVRVSTDQNQNLKDAKSIIMEALKHRKQQEGH